MGSVRENGRVGAVVLWLSLPLLVPACPSTNDDADGGAAGVAAGGSGEAGAAGVSEPLAGRGPVVPGGAIGGEAGAVAQGGVGAVAQGGVGDGGLGEGGAQFSCPPNLCGDGSLWAEGRQCKAERLLCVDGPQDSGCSVMQCCGGVWVLGAACSGEGGSGQ